MCWAHIGKIAVSLLQKNSWGNCDSDTKRPDQTTAWFKAAFVLMAAKLAGLDRWGVLVQALLASAKHHLVRIDTLFKQEQLAHIFKSLTAYFCLKRTIFLLWASYSTWQALCLKQYTCEVPSHLLTPARLKVALTAAAFDSQP